MNTSPGGRYGWSEKVEQGYNNKASLEVCKVHQNLAQIFLLMYRRKEKNVHPFYFREICTRGCRLEEKIKFAFMWNNFVSWCLYLCIPIILKEEEKKLIFFLFLCRLNLFLGCKTLLALHLIPLPPPAKSVRYMT